MNNFYVNEIIGARSWLYNPNQKPSGNKTQLLSAFGSTSANKKHFWDKGVNHSLCRGAMSPHIHTPGKIHKPMRECQCGIYALDGFEQKTHEHKQYLASPTNMYTDSGQDRIIGIIKGYGKVIVTEWGFRCQIAEIVALVDAPWYIDSTREYVEELVEEHSFDHLHLEDLQQQNFFKMYAEANKLNLVEQIPEET